MNDSTFSTRDITIILVNYCTPDLTLLCVDSFINFYPECSFLLIDNGSSDNSRRYIQQLANRSQNVKCIFNKKNIHHGPAMHLGIKSCNTRYVFTLDSDCVVFQGGFLEKMLTLMEALDLYALGHMERKQRFGFEVPPNAKSFIPYIHPHSMLLDKEKYLKLPPFFHHGSPCIRNMKAAQQGNFLVSHFNVGEYIYHMGRGTCSRYGYGLNFTTLLQKFLSNYLFRLL